MFIDRQFRIARYWSNDELHKISHFMKGDIINVSGWKDEDKQNGYYKDYFTQAQNYIVTNYGGYRGFQGNEGEVALDLTAPLPEKLNGRFDVVFNHTTLEHIFEVRTAFQNLALLSRDILIVVVPFAQIQHEHENIKDFWRFTPTCLRALFSENNMDVIYEAANNHPNAASYILMVGSRNADHWKNILPSYTPLSEVASHIGMTATKKIKLFLKKFRY